MIELNGQEAREPNGHASAPVAERPAGPVLLRPDTPARWLTNGRRAKQADQALVKPIPEGSILGRRDTAYRVSLMLADLVATVTAVMLGVMVIGSDTLRLEALLTLPLVPFVSKAVGLYDRDENLIRKTTLDEIPALFQVATLYAFVLWLSENMIVSGELRHRQVIGIWALMFFLMTVSRSVARRVARRVTRPERCLVIGDVESAEPVRRKLRTSVDLNARLIGRVPLCDEPPMPDVLGTLDELGIVLAEHEIDRVLIAPSTTDPELILHTIRMIKSMGVKVSVLPRLFEVVGSAVEFDDLDGIPLLGLRRQGLPFSSRILKRMTDVIGASVILFFLAPALALIAIAIKLDSPGPVLFRQRRIGRHGEGFRIFKFRTMYDGADAMKAQLMSRNEGAEGFFKMAEDPRVTRVGRLLRRTYLDELPQLLNVIKGEMSIVGPRPLVLEDDQRINGWHRQRLDIPPGMTGHWQVLGSSRIPLHEMVAIDYLYVVNWSLWADFKYLLRTVPYVLGARGM